MMNDSLTPFSIWVILIFFILGWGWLVYESLKKQANTLNEQEQSLKKRTALLEQAEIAHQQKQNDFLSYMAEKKEDLDYHSQKSFQQLEEAIVLRETANHQIALLQKKLKKLQSDVHNARQRAQRIRIKRLAEKDGNAVK